MSLIKLKAKVYLLSEEDMELQNQFEGLSPKSGSWVFRNIALESENIYRIVAFARDKTLVIMTDEEKLIVKGTFDEIFKLWEDSLPEDLDLSDPDEQEETDDISSE